MPTNQCRLKTAEMMGLADWFSWVGLGWWAEAHPTSCPTARHSRPTAHFYAVIPAPSPPVQTGTETCTTS
ncbi:TPA: hypothetical protein ACFNMU_002212, partial [Neisseria lactamica]